MSLSYQNDEKPDDFWGPLFLAYRDITGQAPIDKVAYPGVRITPACFPDNVYDGRVFQSCFSNLLSAEHRRFIIDIYWDVSSRDFTLCPAQLPRQTSNTSQEALSPSTTALAGMVPSASLAPRQENTTVSISAPSNTTSEAATTMLSSAISTTTSETGSQLLQLGPYRCSDDLTLESLFNILDGYIEATSDQVRARFATLQFNLHAAALADHPDGLPETLTSSELPRGSEQLGSQFDDNLGGYIYTPGDLAHDRSNLNVSWFQVTTESRLPVTDYYDITKKDDGVWETSNGWPSELFLVFDRFKRFLLTYGTISPEMQRYHVSGDEHHFFLANQTTRFRDFEASAQGTVTSGCYYTESSTDVTQVNNSWARASIDALPQEPDQLLGNLTSCGLGPILNFTLNGTADESYQIYQAFAQAAIFGWAPGEPRNFSSSTDTDEPDDQFRCVVIDSSNAYRGSWRVVNCQEKFRAACRVGGQPFEWRLSSLKTMYGDAPAACQELSGTELGMPRTGLENTYLYQRILGELESHQENSIREGVWINLNSLDEKSCWVTSGPNGSCTYQNDQAERRDREVLIPTLAALIILVLTVLTIVVKCNVNRRNSRVRRLGPGGWEYEGVPS